MKIMKILVGCLALFFLWVSAPGQSSWKGFIPLVTTRSEVEALIGKPGKSGLYEFKDSRVWVKYVETTCDTRCDCMVSHDTVQFIKVELYKPLSLKKLKLGKDFRKVPDSHLPDVISYISDKSGVDYETQKGKAYTVYYNESIATCENIEREFKRNHFSH